MKFILILWVCSFLPGQALTCFPPMKFPVIYNSWYECSVGAHTQSKKVLATISFKRVNDMRMGTKYQCEEIGDNI